MLLSFILILDTLLFDYVQVPRMTNTQRCFPFSQEGLTF